MNANHKKAAAEATIFHPTFAFLFNFRQSVAGHFGVFGVVSWRKMPSRLDATVFSTGRTGEAGKASWNWIRRNGAESGEVLDVSQEEARCQRHIDIQIYDMLNDKLHGIHNYYLLMLVYIYDCLFY